MWIIVAATDVGTQVTFDKDVGTVLPDCPNCCSGIGDCNDGVCECPLGWGGYDCSEPQCSTYFNPFCGITQPFTVSPLAFEDTCAISDTVADLVLYLDSTLSIIQDSTSSSCINAEKQLMCGVYFVPCTQSLAQQFCESTCTNLISECSCNDPAILSCPQIVSQINSAIANVPTVSCNGTIVTTGDLSTGHLDQSTGNTGQSTGNSGQSTGDSGYVAAANTIMTSIFSPLIVIAIAFSCL